MTEHIPRGALVIAADRRTLKAALAKFEPSEISELLASILAERFGRNRAELILERAMKEMNK